MSITEITSKVRAMDNELINVGTYALMATGLFFIASFASIATYFEHPEKINGSTVITVAVAFVGCLVLLLITQYFRKVHASIYHEQMLAIAEEEKQKQQEEEELWEK